MKFLGGSDRKESEIKWVEVEIFVLKCNINLELSFKSNDFVYFWIY